MTNYRLFQIERVCRRQFQIRYQWQKVLKTDRIHCGKTRNCSLRAISPFPTEFSKHLYYRHVKTRACLGKGLELPFSETIPSFHDPEKENFRKHCGKMRK